MNIEKDTLFRFSPPTYLASILYWSIGLVLFIYLALRCYYIPITHDEAGTFLEYVVMPLQNTLLCVPASATNHILHTLLVKGTTELFGNHVFFIRLPVLLSYILYFYFSLQLLQKLTKKPFWIVIGIALLNFHPYLLEFFSLSRGYGLGIAFMMGSVLYAFDYFNGCQNLKRSLLSIVFAALAIYSNFTFGFYYLALAMLLLIHSVFLKYRLKVMDFSVKPEKVVWPVSGVSLILALVTIVPLKNLIEGQAFYMGGHTGFMADTVGSLIRWNLYGQQYFEGWDLQIIAAIVLPLLFAAFLWAIVGYFLHYRSKSIWVLDEKNEKSYFSLSASRLQNLMGLQIFSALLVGIIVLQEFYVFFFEGKYAVGRTALYLLPLAVWVLITFSLYFQRFLFVRITVFFFAAILTFHLLQTLNIRQSYEWILDADTAAMLDFVEGEARAEQKTLSLGVHWLMSPSAEFYSHTQSQPNIEVHSGKRLITNKYDYYYVHRKFAGEYFLENYSIVRYFGNDRIWLLRKTD